jgi:hypothetical protein
MFVSNFGYMPIRPWAGEIPKNVGLNSAIALFWAPYFKSAHPPPPPPPPSFEVLPYNC